MGETETVPLLVTQPQRFDSFDTTTQTGKPLTHYSMEKNAQQPSKTTRTQGTTCTQTPQCTTMWEQQEEGGRRDSKDAMGGAKQE